MSHSIDSLKSDVAEQLHDESAESAESAEPGHYQAIDFAGLLSKFDSVFAVVAPMLVNATPAQYQEIVSGVVSLVKSLIKLAPHAA